MKLIETKIAPVLLGTMFLQTLVPSAFAQQVAKPSQTRQPQVGVANVVEENEESSAPSKPGVEGIKVNGHWIIDRKDKDGTVLEHRDFHNALNISGGDTLVKILAGLAVGTSLQIQAGGYIIYRGDIANHGVPSCNTTPPNAGCVPTLTITYTHFDVPNNVPNSFLTLNGTITPPNAITVSTVQTSALICESPQIPVPNVLNTGSAARCAAGDLDAGQRTDNYPFTGTSITPINVAAGQTLAITVIISFS